MTPNIVHESFREGFVWRLLVSETGLRVDHKAGGDIETDLGHLAEVGPFPSQELLVLAVAFGEGVDVFF